MLLDPASALATLLATSTAPVVPPTQLNFHNVHANSNPLARAQATALLMSSTPVLAHQVRHQITMTALQSVNAAQSMLDLSTGDDEENLAMGMLAESEDSTTGTTAMVGAAAAALALINMRR